MINFHYSALFCQFNSWVYHCTGYNIERGCTCMQAYPRFSFAVFIIHWMYWTIHLKDQWCSTCSKLMRYPQAEINGAAQRTMTHLHSRQLTNDGKDHHRHWHRNDLQESHLYLKHVLGPLQYTTSNLKPQAYLWTGKCCTLISLMLVKRSTKDNWVNHTFVNRVNRLMFIASKISYWG